MPTSRHAKAPVPIDKRKLFLLVACLALAVAATIGSMWYNLKRHERNEADETLISNIVDKLQQHGSGPSSP